MIILRFELYNGQINAIYILFYKKRDLLLLTKIKFGKSLNFLVYIFFNIYF